MRGDRCGPPLTGHHATAATTAAGDGEGTTSPVDSVPISDGATALHGPAGCLGQRLPVRISICDTIRAVIHGFRCKDTERLAAGYRVRRFAAIERAAQRKLAQLAAATLDFLRVPPGNRLEALKGDRTGLHSIRINDQWRL